MSGLSLASHPRLAGAGRHRFGANHVVCALALCALASACPPLWGFRLLCFLPVAPARARGSSCAHTSCLPTRCGVGALCVRLGACLVGACCGRVCSVGGWGLVFAFGACSPFGVCVLWCWRFGGVVGQCGCVRPFASACLLACSRLWCGLVGVCAAAACPMGGGRPGRGGTTVSRPIQRGAAPVACAWKERRVGGEGESAPQGGEHNPLAFAYVGTGTPCRC